MILTRIKILEVAIKFKEKGGVIKAGVIFSIQYALNESQYTMPKSGGGFRG